MDLTSTTTAFLSGLILILVSLVAHKARTSRSMKRRPPGPRALPFIGCIHHVLTSQPQAALRDLAQKHGPVMYLKLGQVDTVVISSPTAAQEALREKDRSLASRPSLLGSEIICYGNRDIAFAPYGDYWRSLRKMCTVELLNASKVRRFAAIRDSETMSLVREIRRACAAASGEPVDLGGLLLSCTNSVTGRAAFGNRCSRELTADFLSAISVVISNISGLCVSDLFPSLRFVDALTGTKRRLRRAHQRLEDVFARIISDGEARRAERKGTGAGAGGDDDDDDLLSVMLRIRDEGEFEIPINNTNIKAIILDLFTGGTETTSSVAEWLMAELMRNPDAMHKAQDEVRQAFEHSSPDEHEAQMDKLRYTKTVIKETLRLYPPLPLLLPRQCRETCDIGGFQVAKGSRVIVNAWAIARSPAHWDDADRFMPERFERDDSAAGYSRATTDGTTQFEYLPFGHGRRICPGMGFGLSTLEILVARLLYYFDWSLPEGMQVVDLDMDMTVGASARRTNKLHLVASPYQVPT
ncbi:putative cytochrome P450 superfamily protein [Zea mays]|uniref:Cytochrome P450 99A2 n=3 Tax=Zea mays TaxID=4577 RepID=B4FS98_MAIZE|nr:putative cytochrome P450 superfamily protein [Zea mays]ACF84991.1 unknown [Zea mays]ONL98899.1 Cytochrome P450 99A2 [Zea mays]|eukprot:NP_001140932.1 putative cytochrome P450 superfamily protein [Zea mays]